MLPSEQVSIALMSNSEYANLRPIARELVKVVVR